MRNLSKTTKKVLSFAMALLMVVSTIFVSDIQAKADTTTYAPTYDAETDVITGAPAVGDIIYSGVTFDATKLPEDVHISILMHDFKEDIGKEDAPWTSAVILNGEVETLKYLNGNNADSSQGWVVASVEYVETVWSETYTEKGIDICVYPKVETQILETVEFSFDITKLSFEIGSKVFGISDGFISGQVRPGDDGYDAYLVACNPTTEDAELVFTSEEDAGEYLLNETDEYILCLNYLYAPAGYYYAIDLECSSTVFEVEKNPQVWSPVMDDNSTYGEMIYSISIELGTGAEILAAIEEANSEDNSQEPGDSQEPSEEEEVKNDHSAKLERESDVASKVELTEEEKTAIANGDKLEVVLGFKDVGATATTDEQKAIEKALADKKIGTFLDIDLTKKVGTTEVAVTETTGLVAITFELPDALKNTDKDINRTYSVLRYHDGKVDTLDVKYDVEKGTITFETDKFSTYAVVYSDVSTLPNMGDASAMFLVYAVLGVGIILVASRKKNRV